MAFEARSPSELAAKVRGAIRQYLPGTDATLWQNVLNVLAKALGLFAHEFELRQQRMFRQMFLHSADIESHVRDECAGYGIFQRAASVAVGEVTTTAVASRLYPAGIRYVAGATTYVTTEPATSNAFGVLVLKVQSEQRGAAVNRDGQAVLNLADPALFPGLAATATVLPGGLGGGADKEDIESLRRRGLRRKRTPPQGGALSDYEGWALEIPGVANVWADQFTNALGWVGLWFTFDNRPNGIPSAADVAVVQTAIEARRVIRSQFYAIAPTPMPIDLTIALSPDSIDTRQRIYANLVAFFDATDPDTRIRPGLPGRDFEVSLSWLSEVISVTDGEGRHVLLEPSVAPVATAGHLPVLGTISWV